MHRSQQTSTHEAEKQSTSKLDNKGAHEEFTIQTQPMATIQDDDDRLLARIGYKQELRREFTKWSTVSYAISILGVLGSQPATYGVPLSLGGPATAVWAWFIGSFMAFVIASSGVLIDENHATCMLTLCSCGARLCISYRRWHVLRHEACCST